MLDEQIIELFFERSEQAINELDGKYGKVFHNLSYNILNDRWDAEECVNDSYLGAWNVIPPERPNPLLTFVCKIVRNISIKKYHAKTAIKRNSAYDVGMSERLFSEAMGELSDKYIIEAINYSGKKNEQNIFFWVRRCVAVASLIFIVGFGMLMAVSTEARAAVWGWVKEFQAKNTYKFFFNGDAEEAVGLKYELGWLPEGTEFVTKYDVMGGEAFIYTDETELVISFTYSTDPDSVYYLVAEDAVKLEVTVNGLPGEIFISPSEEETNTIVWSDNSVPVMFTFTAEYDAETLIKVAENIKVIEVDKNE